MQPGEPESPTDRRGSPPNRSSILTDPQDGCQPSTCLRIGRATRMAKAGRDPVVRCGASPSASPLRFFADRAGSAATRRNDLQYERRPSNGPGMHLTRRNGVVDSRTAPAVGTVTADTPLSASPRSAVPPDTASAPAGGNDGRAGLSQALGLQVVAARAGRSPSTTRSARAAAGLDRRTPRDGATGS